jgi:hypothetical protein
MKKRVSQIRNSIPEASLPALAHHRITFLPRTLGADVRHKHPNFDTLRWIWALRLDAEFNETRTFRVSEGGFWRNTCCGTS